MKESKRSRVILGVVSGLAALVLFLGSRLWMIVAGTALKMWPEDGSFGVQVANQTVFYFAAPAMLLCLLTGIAVACLCRAVLSHRLTVPTALGHVLMGLAVACLITAIVASCVMYVRVGMAPSRVIWEGWLGRLGAFFAGFLPTLALLAHPSATATAA